MTGAFREPSRVQVVNFLLSFEQSSRCGEVNTRPPMWRIYILIIAIMTVQRRDGQSNYEFVGVGRCH